MKRSEAIKKLDEALWGYTDLKHGMFISADSILALVEDLGMLPPSTILPIKGGYGINDATHVMLVDGDYVGAHRINKWDAE